jgi:hypothetical protein
MSKARTQDINSVLEGRGIVDSCTRHGWQPQGNSGWRYPIFDLQGDIIGYRKKLLNNPTYKYLWDGGKPDHPIAEWYILPGTAQAIQDADGICYLANGEPALHAYLSATVYNTIATTLSEVAVPKNILSILSQLGVKKLVNIADSDEAGLTAAINWRDALYDSGIAYQALQWPDYLGDKADGNDLWIWHSFDAEAFKDTITHCQALLLPAYEITPDAPSNTDIPDITEPLSKTIADAITSRMTGNVHKGFHMHKCVHHEDAHASAGFDPQTGVINCFTCGSHSPYETADVLGIDWRSFYPKREYAPTARPARDEVVLQAAQDKLQAINEAYQADRQKIADKIIDFADYYQTKDGQFEMVRHAHMEYLHGIYRSWWQTKDIPIGHLSAIMNLNNTRSSTALVLGRMHEALLDGRLSHAVLSIPLVSDVIGLSVRVVSNAFIELEQGGYIRFVDTYSLYNILHSVYKIKDMPLDSASTPYLNVTPARLWTLNLDSDDLHYRLYHQLCVKKTEAYHRRTIAKTSAQMATDMSLSLAEFKALESLDSLFAKDKLSKKAQAELRIELEGDRKGQWKGWKHSLKSEFTIPLDWQSYETIKDVRIGILRYWIANVRAQNSRKQLSRLLGCSDTTVDNIMASGDMVSVRQDRKKEIDATFDDLRPHIKQLQRDECAEIWSVKFKEWDNDLKKHVWYTANTAYAARHYKDNRDNVSKVLFLYIVPSYQYIKSSASWALNWQRFIVIMAHWMLCKHADILTGETAIMPDDMADITPVISGVKSSDNTPAEDKTTLSMQHVYMTHTPAFCKDQMALRVEMATGYKVVGQSVVNADNQVIFMPLRGKRPNGLLQFIQDNQVGKLVRKSYEVFGKDVEDYDDELNAEYKQERLDMLSSLVEVPDFDMPDETKVVQMPLKERKLSEREQLLVDSWNARYEAEKQETQGSRFAFIREGKPENITAMPLAPDRWIDDFGYENEIRKNGKLYVDGIEQKNVNWQYVKREIERIKGKAG